jgi:hypothetical protein
MKIGKDERIKDVSVINRRIYRQMTVMDVAAIDSSLLSRHEIVGLVHISVIHIAHECNRVIIWRERET